MEKINLLAIETSCDDTAVAAVIAFVDKNKLKKFEVVSSKISSQVALHAGYGGVYPTLAKREHQKNLPQVFKEATKGIDVKSLDFFAVTTGPGLDPCLWTGINFVQELMGGEKKPAIPVNHVEAHILANFLTKKTGETGFSGEADFQKNLPAVCLVVSGGHTILFKMDKIGRYKLLGGTRDDAAGECFDKTARILGLGYPGGAAIATQALRWTKRKNKTLKIALPRPMINQKNFDFSFSGLKTAVLYYHRSQKPEVAKSTEYLEAMSHEIQQAIVDVLVAKTIRAAKEFKTKSIIIGGGVAANEKLRKTFQILAKKEKIILLIPSVKYCGDNAAMIAVAGYFVARRGEAVASPGDLRSEPNLNI